MWHYFDSFLFFGSLSDVSVVDIFPDNSYHIQHQVTSDQDSSRLFFFFLHVLGSIDLILTDQSESTKWCSVLIRLFYGTVVVVYSHGNKHGKHALVVNNLKVSTINTLNK